MGVFLIALAAACTRPGPREEGRGDAAWDGRPPVRWSGPCVYEAQTRWASPLPHVIRLVADTSEWSIVVSSSNGFPDGRTSLSPTGEGETQAIVLEGATVRGSVLGEMEVARGADSTFISIVGMKAYRDSVSFEATCRLGELSTNANG